MSYDLMLQAPLERVTQELIQRVKTSVGDSPVLCASEPKTYEPGAPPFGTLDDLEDACEENPRIRRDYKAYCTAHCLDRDSDLAAGRFLEQLYPISVLTVHLSNDPAAVQAAFAELRTITRAFGLALHDPQAGYDILDTYTGSLPPHF